jgi:hypothetical protein
MPIDQALDRLQAERDSRQGRPTAPAVALPSDEEAAEDHTY